VSDSVVILYGAAVLLAVLLSALANRSPLSTATVFLVAGLVGGPVVTGWVEVDLGAAERTATVALFVILFTDGQHAPLSVLREHWGPPARALVLGMPLGFALVAAAAVLFAGLPWPAALLLGAILAPTDPVFASALVGRDDVSPRVRHLLNIESGLNDGIALPAVLVLIGTVGGDPRGQSTDLGVLLLEAVAGLGIGVAIPVAIAALLRIPAIGAAPGLQPVGVLATAVLLYGVCSVTHANPFLAAFVAGSTVATVRPQASHAFEETGGVVSELVKGAAVLAFACQLDRGILSTAGWAAVAVALAAILVARPLPTLLVLVRSRLSMTERAAVAWFGPKGFASIVYGVIVVRTDEPMTDTVFAITAVTVLISLVAHSGSDAAVAGRLRTPTDSDPEIGYDDEVPIEEER
jgi:NhaP-type Na+/H+ or K+/H+ antiporter